MTVSLASLLVAEAKAAIYDAALAVATTLGLPVTSWQPGDPTRSLYHVLSEQLETLETVAANYVASGFLDHATGDWLTLLAAQVYGVTRTEATYASATVTLTNGGGGLFDGIEAGDITAKSSTSDETYTNTSGGTLASGPGTTLDLDFTADAAGSDGSAGATEIDTLVTTMLLVTISNAVAATGIDAESDDDLRIRCRNKLGSLSPNGPADAYNYVALTSSLTGTTGITRTRTVADSATGDVTLYLAGPSGAVSGADVTLVEAAIVEWATPLCITPTIVSATNVVVAVTYELWIYNAAGVTAAEAEAEVQTALAAMFAARPIGGDVVSGSGALRHSLIESVIRNVYPAHAFDVAASVPAGDTALTIGQVATLGAVTPTITFVANP